MTDRLLEAGRHCCWEMGVEKIEKFKTFIPNANFDKSKSKEILIVLLSEKGASFLSDVDYICTRTCLDVVQRRNRYRHLRCYVHRYINACPNSQNKIPNS